MRVFTKETHHDGGKMSVRTLTAGLLAAFMMLSGFATVEAQQRSPIADPFEFDPDFRWFEPVSQMDFDDMKPSKRANTGWFASYDRLNLYGSRPELDNTTSDSNQLDSGWGHRYEVGYMLPSANKGWLFNWTENRVAEFFSVRRERVNRVNTDQLAGTPTLAAPPFGFILPEADGNTPGFNERIVFVSDSENVLDYDSYELNKTWRMEPYRYGGILEPMVGVRWLRLTDTNLFQTFNSSLDIDTIPFLTFGPDAEQLITDQTITDNEIFTGQVGFRYTKFRDRFVFSADCRLFTGASIQTSRSNELTEITIYAGPGLNAAVTNILNRETAPVYSRNEEFSIGFDIRGELAYQLTKQLTVRAGFQLIDVASGVWRGGSQNPAENQLSGGPTDQNALLFGGTVGLTLNR